MADRYFIDERVGCIAVRDRENTDLEYQGLHSDTQGVVKFWGGELAEDCCPTCGHTTTHHTVPAATKAKAILLCAELNAKHQPCG